MKRIKAFLISATILFSLGIMAPAMTIKPLENSGNLKEILKIFSPESVQQTTFSIFTSIVKLFQHGDYAIATVILVFSVLFPVWKMTALWVSSNRIEQNICAGKSFKVAYILGKYSMIDVFVIALLVLSVKTLPGGSEVAVHWGVYIFAASVILSSEAARELKKLIPEDKPAEEIEETPVKE